MTRLTQGAVDMRYIYPSSYNIGKIAADYDYGSGETVTYADDALKRPSSASGSGWGQSFSERAGPFVSVARAIL